MNTWLPLICTCLLIAGAWGSPRYHPVTCPPLCILGCPEIACRYGAIKLHPCDCCPVCAKGPGEDCGGVVYEIGKCAEKLTCKVTGDPNGRGVCERPYGDTEETEIKKGKLVHVGILDLPRYGENSGLDGSGYDLPGNNGNPDSMCLNCAAVSCLSPEGLGCPYSFISDPCKCCPRCI